MRTPIQGSEVETEVCGTATDTTESECGKTWSSKTLKFYENIH